MSKKPDFQLLFESSPALYLVLSPDLKILFITKSYASVIGIRLEDIYDKNVFEAFPDNPNDPNATGVANLRASLNKVILNKVPDSMAVQQYDVAKKDESGFETRYWSILNSPVIGADNSLHYIINKVEDITEFVRLKEKESKQQKINEELQSYNGRVENEILARAQEIQEANKQLLVLNEELGIKSVELARSNAELEQFASIAAHDIQAPFRTVGLSLEMIELKFQDHIDAETKKLFQRISMARERVRSLIKDLLDFARVTQAPQPSTTFGVTILLDDVLKSIGETNSKITIDPSLPEITGDYSQLSQVFQNLICNALKFTNAEKPEIHIFSEELPEFYKFCVRDNGIGINAKFSEKIFQVFQRLHSQEEYAGTGLGLAICRKIIERHSGKIWVESVEGVGTSFYFTIPKK
jgi:light-regulated signal transduction histidine kinase (bacteriophytochrome)